MRDAHAAGARAQESSSGGLFGLGDSRLFGGPGRAVARMEEALAAGIERLEEAQVDRAVICISPAPMAENAVGRWFTSEEGRYYPYETLTRDEQIHIKPHADASRRDSESYIVVSLVRDNVGGMRTYESAGVEYWHRSAMEPVLPDTTPEAGLQYINDNRFFGRANLREAAKYLSDAGLTPAEISQSVESGISDYQAVTSRLLTEAGVFERLQQMDASGYRPAADRYLEELAS